MPELPEVEVVRRDLDKEFSGKRIKAAEITGSPRSVRRQASPEEFAERLVGCKVTKVGRRGKYILMSLDSGDVLVIHLGMSGQLIQPKSARDAAPKHTHVVITFTQGPPLRFVDPRTFGEMFVTKAADLDEIEELAHLGVDPLETAISWDYFGQLLHQRRTKLKPLLMDQKFLAGVGNIYSDEILWEAGLRWDRLSNELSPEEVRRLYRAMVEILQSAVKYRGSSLADQQYVDLQGRTGSFQDHHNVYAREGKQCRRCRAIVVRSKVGGRSTFYCDACQV